MLFYLKKSRSDNTVKKYRLLYKKFNLFSNNIGLSPMPSGWFLIALYVTSMIDGGSTANAILSSVYAIKWMNEINGFKLDLKNPILKNMMESAKRNSKRKVTNRKDPVSTNMIKELVIKCNKNDLIELRDLTMIVLGFTGFLRYDEISSIRAKDVEMHTDYVKIKIPKSKCDQYRTGNEVVIKKGNTAACPVTLIRKYFKISNINEKSSEYIFRPAFRRREICKLIRKDKKLSYTTARERIVKMLKSTSEGKYLNLGLHSLRAGGATTAANKNIKDRCIKAHGRWASDSSKNRYVKDSLNNRLEVTAALGL